MPTIHKIAVQVTAENLWFVERHLNVFDFAEIFPADAFSSDNGRGIPVTLHTDAGFDILTDIDRSKMQIRNRSKFRGWIRWTMVKALRAGDRIIIEKTGEREYRLELEREN